MRTSLFLYINLKRMNNKPLPLTFSNLDDSIYVVLGYRLLAKIIDIFISFIFILSMRWWNPIQNIEMNSFDQKIHVNIYFTLFYTLIFIVFYNIICVKIWGGTLGKLIMKIKIIQINGRPLEWKHAFLRYIFFFGAFVINTILIFYALLFVDDTFFINIHFRLANMPNINPNILNDYDTQIVFLLQNMDLFKHKSEIIFFSLVGGLFNLGNLISLLVDQRYQSLEDKIGGTVLIKEKYNERLQNWLDRQEGSKIDCPGCGKRSIVKRYGNFQCSNCNTRFTFTQQGIIRK